MPLILSGNVASAISGAYEVANSCRFDGTSAGMTKASVAGTRTKATFSTWVKRGNVTAEEILFYSRIDASNHFLIRFTGAEKLEIVNRIGGSNISIYTTNAVYRDPSAWMHVLWIFDTTQGTAGNRIKLFVNGTQVTSWATSTTQDADTNLAANTTSDDYYVAQEYTSGSNWFGGYLAETVWVDGTAYAASDFGEFDEDSPTIWKPIDVSGLTFGNSGFYLDYEDSSNLGNDKGTVGTDLTEANLAATDQTTDTPTNNFATWNPLDNFYTAAVFTEGNVVQQGTDTPNTPAVSTMGMTAGKWYCEVKPIAVSNEGDVYHLIGVISTQITANNQALGHNSSDYAYIGQSGNIRTNNTHDTSYGDTYTLDDIIGVALNLDDNELKFYKNGTVQNSGTAISITAAASTPLGAYFFGSCIWQNSENGTYAANFGNPSYANSSSVADENGYGDFEYSVPSGYLALCTKNLGSDGG